MSLDEPRSSVDSLGNKKIRLRPISSISREEVIEKNLISLQENLSKKKRAQAYYYNQKFGKSALLRISEEKQPVHTRLGQKQRNRLKVPFIGTNVNSLLPRNRLQINMGHNKNSFSVQNRLYNKFRQNVNQSSMVFTNSKRFTLQRNVPTLKVQVLNNSAPSLMCTRFQLILNPVYQEDIRQIQLENPRQIFHGIHPIMPATTTETLNERFSRLT
ncbi:hypothetical protein HHI36_004295 [Cryptolaemus montrouzieri]|uniref:Ribosomal protein S4 n=1 Tax=Cryptolaemus montrouzieri TaxID=559131 RepID=A0ABD2NQS1_9CUCU